MKTLSNILTLFTFVAAVGCGSALAQTANWTGGFDTDWNNPANWDIGTPAEGTNAVLFPGAIVDYNVPMAATSFAGVNNGGTLNVSAAGFNINAAGLAAYTAGAPSLLRINSGGVVVATNSGTIAFPTGSEVAVEGGVLIITNSTGNITFGANGNFAGAGFTNNGGTVIFSQPFQSRGRFSRFEQHGGTLSFLGGGGIFESSNDQERKFLIDGGTANLGNFAIGRTLNTVGSAGLVISNGNVNTTSLIVGNGIAAGGATIFGGTLTNTGLFTIADRTNAATSGQRRIFFYVRGGTVVSTGLDGIIVGNQANITNTGGSSVWGGFLDINAGTLIAEKITLVGPNALTNAHGTLTLAGSGAVYLGSGGLVGNVGYSNTSYTMTFSGGSLGAIADYSIVGNGTLSGTFTVNAADPANAPHNIIHTGTWSGSGGLTKTGGGILTLNSNNTYTGATAISAGTLALGVNGSLVNTPQITLAAGATFDVTAAAPYSLASGKILQGAGSVSGSFIANGGASLRPAGAGAVGLMTFSGGLTQNGGVLNAIEFGALTNDVIEVGGDLILNPAATNTFVISSIGGSIPAGTYTLMHYSGALLNGGATNFSLSGIPGTIIHNAGAKTISVTTTGLRSPTSIFWVGTGGGGDWDALNSLNWNDGAPAAYFVNGDVVRFDANGAANPAVNVTQVVAPASVTVDAATDYSLSGVGSIAGTGSLTKTNSGKLTLQTGNSYTGPTVVSGGTLSFATIANGGFASGIGASAASAANLVLANGILEYTGATASSDRGATLGVGGGTVAIPAATLTLNGTLTGDGALTKAGAGSLALGGANNYTNGTVINGGALQANNAAATGTGGVTNNGATLRIGGGTTVTLVNVMNLNGDCTVDLNNVAGDVHLTGAWSGSGIVSVISQQNASRTFTIGGNGGGGGGMSEFSGTINMGTNAGSLRYNDGGGSPNLGSPTATIDLGTGAAVFLVRNGGVTIDVGELKGGPNTAVRGRASGSSGTVTYSIGAKGTDSTFSGAILDSTVAGNFTAITKVGAGKLVLAGNSTYSGNTIVNGGTLQVDGAISATPFVSVFAGTLSGSGTIGGAVDMGPNTVLSPGAGGIGQMTMSGTLALQFGSTNVMEINKTAGTSDSIIGLQSLFYGGTLVVSNLGGTLADGDVFKLFDSVPGTYFGDYNSYELPVLGPNLYWDTSKLIVDGTIRVFTPRPIIETFGIAGGNFFLNGTNGGNTSMYYIVLTSLDASLPLANWMPLQTNAFDGSGNFTYTNAVNPNEAQRYYRLKTP